MFLCGTDKVNQHFPEDGNLGNLGAQGGGQSAVGEVNRTRRGNRDERQGTDEPWGAPGPWFQLCLKLGLCPAFSVLITLPFCLSQFELGSPLCQLHKVPI